jgi:hypothetical protein
MPRGKKWLLQSPTEITAEHVQPIIDLLKARKFEEANTRFKEFCSSVKDLKNFEAFTLSMKIIQESGMSAEMNVYAATRPRRQLQAQQPAGC